MTTTTQKKKKKKKKINRPIKNFSNTVSDSCITMIRKLHHRIEDAGKVVFAKKTTKCIKPAVVPIRETHTFTFHKKEITTKLSHALRQLVSLFENQSTLLAQRQNRCSPKALELVVVR